MRSVEAGCSGFVAKTEPIDVLVAAVRGAQAGEVFIAPAMLARLIPRLTLGRR